jgi:hypothetical protein
MAVSGLSDQGGFRSTPVGNTLELFDSCVSIDLQGGAIIKLSASRRIEEICRVASGIICASLLHV